MATDFDLMGPGISEGIARAASDLSRGIMQRRNVQEARELREAQLAAQQRAQAAADVRQQRAQLLQIHEGLAGRPATPRTASRSAAALSQRGLAEIQNLRDSNLDLVPASEIASNLRAQGGDFVVPSAAPTGGVPAVSMDEYRLSRLRDPTHEAAVRRYAGVRGIDERIVDELFAGLGDPAPAQTGGGETSVDADVAVADLPALLGDVDFGKAQNKPAAASRIPALGQRDGGVATQITEEGIRSPAAPVTGESDQVETGWRATAGELLPLIDRHEQLMQSADSAVSAGAAYPLRLEAMEINNRVADRVHAALTDEVRQVVSENDVRDAVNLTGVSLRYVVENPAFVATVAEANPARVRAMLSSMDIPPQDMVRIAQTADRIAGRRSGAR